MKNNKLKCYRMSIDMALALDPDYQRKQSQMNELQKDVELKTKNFRKIQEYLLRTSRKHQQNVIDYINSAWNLRVPITELQLI